MHFKELGRKLESASQQVESMLELFQPVKEAPAQARPRLDRLTSFHIPDRNCDVDRAQNPV
jgi:hypothetical protein